MSATTGSALVAGERHHPLRGQRFGTAASALGGVKGPKLLILDDGDVRLIFIIGKFETTNPTRQVRLTSTSPTTRTIRNGLISPATRSRRCHSSSREWSSSGRWLCASGMGFGDLGKAVGGVDQT